MTIANKIITTIGPSTASTQQVKLLRDAGASSFRINLSHSNEESLDSYIDFISKADVLPSIDTQGAQLRVFGHPRKSFYSKGEQILVGFDNSNHLSDFEIVFNHCEVLDQIAEGDCIKIDFCGLILKVLKISHESYSFVAEVANDGKVTPNCSVDIIDKSIKLDAFTSFDLYAIKNSIVKGIESIYVSFTNCGDDIKFLRRLINEQKPLSFPHDPTIIAKIESRQGINNLESILPLVDGILIDRGDLSREVSISRIPLATKAILQKCTSYDVPCYVATNVLDSMITSPLPSRAEISDLFNMYENNVSGIVLAAEVAIGKYPVDCVHVVKYIHSIFSANNDGFLSVLPHSYTIHNMPQHLAAWL
ncbi:pyruvate kinase [Synechococcus sp. UW179B]|uniref:pyruvate kinase n=1 Tax=Synechococcus sp. UW179B TaxID=2575516 RepID=UPI000E0F8197|nr:pyruvate kinase [Synechococcus sp. UW179B]